MRGPPRTKDHCQTQERFSKALNKPRGYGMTISMLFYSVLGSHNLQPIAISISAATVFGYFCMSTISQCHPRRLLPKPRSKSNQNSQRSTTSQTLARGANSSASRYTAMVLGSVSVTNPISPQSLDDLAWSILTVSRRPWTPISRWTWPRNGGRWNWKISQTMRQSWGH